MTLLHLDAQKLVKDFHGHLADSFGFPDVYGKNTDALIDCLTYLDDPKSGMSKITVGRGDVLTLVVKGSADLPDAKRRCLTDLANAVAFVNMRRIEAGDPPLLALAFS